MITDYEMVQIRDTQREIIRTGQLVARHPESFAISLTYTSLRNRFRKQVRLLKEHGKP